MEELIMTRKERQILKAIDEHIVKLNQLADKAEDELQCAYYLGKAETYIKIKQEFKETTNSLDINKLWPSILSLAEIGAIMIYEQRNVISTKALSFVTKGRV